MATDRRAELTRERALYEGFDYTAFWQEPGRAHLDRLERRVVRDLLPVAGRRVVDVGGGFGRLVPAYVDRFDEPYLVDGAWSMLEMARKRWADRVVLVAADLGALPFRRGAFDAAVMVRVLHHVDDIGSTLAGVRRVLSPGGDLVFNVSNKRNAARIGRHLLRRPRPEGEESPFRRGAVRYGPHSLAYHPRDAEAELVRVGFVPERWRGVGVMDKVAAHAGPLAPAVPIGVGLSRVLGRVRLAPSLFCRARAVQPGVAGRFAADPFACPRCSSRLAWLQGGFVCHRCARGYPRRDGILDFRL